MAKILLVDDDVLVRDSLHFALTHAGHDVTTAGNGDEGLAAIARETFDLVILDMLMPEREGIETIREIRKTRKDLPVLAMSGGDKTGWSDFLRMATVLGANDTLAKPFTATQLLERVDRLLAGPPAATKG